MPPRTGAGINGGAAVRHAGDAGVRRAGSGWVKPGTVFQFRRESFCIDNGAAYNISMSTLTVELSDRARMDAERRAAAGGFESVEAYIAELVEENAAVDSELETLLSQRAAAADAGEMQATDFDAIRTRVRNAARD